MGFDASGIIDEPITAQTRLKREKANDSTDKMS